MGALSTVEKERIQEQVQGLLNEWHYNDEKDTYVDIIKFAQAQGFIVGTADLPDSEDGFLLIDPKGDTLPHAVSASAASSKRKIIGVNRERSLEWKRFVIAHELAHSFIHWNPEMEKGIYLHRENRKGKDEQENDADFFAACLLMPRKSFKSEYEKLSAAGYSRTDTCFKLVEIFKAPFESVSRRIDEVADPGAGVVEQAGQ